jgi:ketosteroid isomerase-like protein
MSQENVAVVKGIHERWLAGEHARDLISEEIEYVNPSYAVEAGVKRGRRTLGAIRDIYPDFRFEPEQYLEAGDDVVVIGVGRGTSQSGVKAQWPQGYVWTVRDGRAVRFSWFSDPAEALDAAGLAGAHGEARGEEAAPDVG